MHKRSSSSVRVFYPSLSRDEVVDLLRERLPELAKKLPFPGQSRAVWPLC